MACQAWCSKSQNLVNKKDDPDSRLVTWEIELASLSNWAYNNLFKAFMGDSPSVPTQFYVGACSTTSSPLAAGTELSGGGYARFPVTFERVSDVLLWNTEQLASAAATAGWSVASMVLYDALTGGNYWAYGNLSETLNVASGESIVIPDEKLSIQGYTDT